ncbi:MAG: TolC family protein [Paludisphaera borealis]|uniref:TolC family protein n=1 Tax=Paludisphaera borealis TaxID=1387353 RepID=UPI00284A8A26|nr:TolC family protein [Paludisphaera borealis]MDR3622923.1 TolC family protein [Paludisphaera borealis]
MTNRYAWPWMAVVLLVIAWGGPAPCSAQTPPKPNSAPPATPTSAPAMPAPGRQPTTPSTPAAPSVRSVASTQPSPPGQPSLSNAVETMKLKTAPLEPTDLRFPINLATALRLSDARPLIVAAAQASVWVAEAQLTRAKVIWVPVFTFGADYIRHDGGGPDFNKGVMTSPSVNFFYGGLAGNLYVNLTDAFFEPLVARQVLNSRQWDIQSAKNDALLQTSTAYFSVHQYRGMYAGALYTVERGHDLIERINQLSHELVPKVEVDRARNMVADLEQQATAAREAWRVHSANLTQVLRLDPRAVVVPLEHDHLQVTLINPKREFDDLMPIALANRPELASQRALIQAAEARIRREKMRPLLPAVQINGFQSAGMLIQAGLFGLGPNSSMGPYAGRVDISYQLVWQLDAFGVGNLARVKQQRGQESKAIVEFRRTQDVVAADVNRAQAHLQSATARVSQADRALRTAVITFNGHLEGLRHTTRLDNVLVLIFRPQEAVYSLELMKLAFDEYFTTVADYNRSQFELFHALGYPARELADLRPAGEVLPVDTARPSFLPPVGNGPPRATR